MAGQIVAALAAQLLMIAVGVVVAVLRSARPRGSAVRRPGPGCHDAGYQRD